KSFFLLAIMFVFSLFVIACGDTTSKDKGDQKEDRGKNEGDAKIDENGVLNYAVDQAPEGLFISGFAGSAIDSEVNDFIHDDLVPVNENMEYEPNLASWETEDNKVSTFTLEEGVKRSEERRVGKEWRVRGGGR